MSSQLAGNGHYNASTRGETIRIITILHIAF